MEEYKYKCKFCDFHCISKALIKSHVYEEHEPLLFDLNITWGEKKDEE